MTKTPSPVEVLKFIAQQVDYRETLDMSDAFNRGMFEGSKLLREYALQALNNTQDSGEGEASFQERVQPWMLACFNIEIAADKLERNDRFIEEALELVQASAYPAERAHALVEYVYGRPQGDINQEVGGVMVTLAAHCLAHGVDMHAEAERELSRINQPDVIVKIRSKQAAKPKGSALPIAAPHTEAQGSGAESAVTHPRPEDGLASTGQPIVRLADRRASSNRAILDRIEGAPSHPATAESKADPSNPNIAPLPQGVWPDRKAAARTVHAAMCPDGEAAGFTYDKACDAHQRYCDRIADAVLVALAPSSPWQPTHRHVKRGTDYEVLGRAVIQAAEPLDDEEYVIVYRGQDGQLWARCADEFNDGRFIPLPMPIRFSPMSTKSRSA